MEIRRGKCRTTRYDARIEETRFEGSCSRELTRAIVSCRRRVNLSELVHFGDREKQATADRELRNEDNWSDGEELSASATQLLHPSVGGWDSELCMLVRES